MNDEQNLSPSGPSGKPATQKTRNRRFGVVAAVLVAAIVFLLVFANSSDEDPTADGVVWAAKASESVSEGSFVPLDGFSAVQVDDSVVYDSMVVGETAGEVNTEMATLLGSAVSRYVPEGSFIDRDMFGLQGELSLILEENERLISVQATPGRAVGSNLKVGDVVDVVAVGTILGDPLAARVVSAVEIVDINLDESLIETLARSQVSSTNTGSGSPEIPADPIPGTYVLRVDRADVNKIALVDASSDLYLVYRADDGSASEEIGEVAPVDLVSSLCDVTVPDGIILADVIDLGSLPDVCVQILNPSEFSLEDTPPVTAIPNNEVIVEP